MIKASTDTEQSLCVLRMSRQFSHHSRVTQHISGKKSCGKDVFSHLQIKGSVKFSLSITGASKCMPQKYIEEDTQQLHKNIKWQICREMCMNDELCVSFNYLVIETSQKNFTRSIAISSMNIFDLSA